MDPTWEHHGEVDVKETVLKAAVTLGADALGLGNGPPSLPGLERKSRIRCAICEGQNLAEVWDWPTRLFALAMIGFGVWLTITSAAEIY